MTKILKFPGRQTRPPVRAVCDICSRPYVGYGHNAEPVTKGRCCDDCNVGTVTPERLKLFVKREDTE